MDGQPLPRPVPAENTPKIPTFFFFFFLDRERFVLMNHDKGTSVLLKKNKQKNKNWSEG